MYLRKHTKQTRWDPEENLVERHTAEAHLKKHGQQEQLKTTNQRRTDAGPTSDVLTAFNGHCHLLSKP